MFMISGGLSLGLLLLGCSGDDSREGDTSIFGDDDGIDGEGSSSTTSGDADSFDGETGKLDMMVEDTSVTAEGGDEQGCAAIDFLFVIDNSGSMGDNQQALIASFPGFIQKIQETVTDATSYQIMVVDTDSYWNDCTVECAFFPLMCQFGDVNACDGAPSVCDETLGGGVTFPVGSDASNQYCELTGGQRYITEQEPFAALPQKFTCIASVGTDGDSDEKPLQALTAAVSPELQGPGGCNTGFLRDDAVLVLTIITDEEDGSLGTPNGLYQNIVAQKGGHPENVVVLGLINDGELPGAICPVEAVAPRIVEFMSYFPNSMRGSICDLNYAPVFEQAVDLINTTCEEYVPIG
ncbi:hypothetical protein ACNOYE_28370 [Nannocystaceae bacterium ST9]